MKLSKVLGVSAVVLGTACLGAYISNGIREEKMNRELWESYSKKYRTSVDTMSVDSVAAKKAYFEASQMVGDSIKSVTKIIK